MSSATTHAHTEQTPATQTVERSERPANADANIGQDLETGSMYLTLVRPDLMADADIDRLCNTFAASARQSKAFVAELAQQAGAAGEQHEQTGQCQQAAGGTLATLNAAYSAVMKASDASTLAQECFSDLFGLFQAIKDLSSEMPTVQSLAGIGTYLADDWQSLHCEQIDELQEHLEALRSLCSKPAMPAVLPTCAPSSVQCGLLDAALKLQDMIASGDICIRYPSPLDAADARRTALDDFAAAVARGREAHGCSLS